MKIASSQTCWLAQESTRKVLRRASGTVAVLTVLAAAIGVPVMSPQLDSGTNPVLAIARADCPPDCGGGPGNGGMPSGPPGGGTEFVPPSIPAMPSYDPGRGQPPLDQNNGISIYNSAAPQPSQAAQPSQAPVQNQDGTYNRAANGEQQPINYSKAPENQQVNSQWQQLSDQLNQQRGQGQSPQQSGQNSGQTDETEDDNSDQSHTCSIEGVSDLFGGTPAAADLGPGLPVPSLTGLTNQQCNDFIQREQGGNNSGQDSPCGKWTDTPSEIVLNPDPTKSVDVPSMAGMGGKAKYDPKRDLVTITWTEQTKWGPMPGSTQSTLNGQTRAARIFMRRIVPLANNQYSQVCVNSKVILKEGPAFFCLPDRYGDIGEEQDELTAYLNAGRKGLKNNELSSTGRVSTQGELRSDADEAARSEKTKNPSRYPKPGDNPKFPEGLVVGHGPDTTWVGKADPPEWIPMLPNLNSSLGAQSGNFPIGFKPTDFIQGKALDAFGVPTFNGEGSCELPWKFG